MPIQLVTAASMKTHWTHLTIHEGALTMHNCTCHCNDSKKEKGSQAGGALRVPPVGDVFLAVIAVTGAIVRG